MLARYILCLTCFYFGLSLPYATAHADDIPPSNHKSGLTRFWENYLDQDCFKNDIEALICGDAALNGILQAKNPERARYWYGKGVALNYAPSMINLANMYESGQGGPKDISAAFQLRQKAVALNDPDGMVSLGQMYMNGLGTPQDRQKGLSLYKRSAAQGDSEGQYMLGMAYYRGWGAAKDDTKAFRLFKKAARQGLPEGMLALANIYESPQHNYKKTLKWFTKAANHGSVAALYGLIVLYNKGLGTEPDSQAVQTLTQKLIQLKGPSTLCGIAQEYQPDPTGTYDYKRAVYWYEAAAAKNEQCAYPSLGNFYFLGQGVMRDFRKAKYWYDKIDNNNDAAALNNLGEIYNYGYGGVPQTFRKLVHSMKNASSRMMKSACII